MADGADSAEMGRRGFFGASKRLLMRTAAEFIDAGKEAAGELPFPAKKNISIENWYYSRPPGSVEEEIFIEKCTRCNKCIEACGFQMLINAPSHMGRAFGTPVMPMDNAVCAKCPDKPCSKVCEPGLIRPGVSDSGDAAQTGGSAR